MRVHKDTIPCGPLPCLWLRLVYLLRGFPAHDSDAGFIPINEQMKTNDVTEVTSFA